MIRYLMYQPQNDYDLTASTVQSVNTKMNTIRELSSKKSFFLGFDGYIDSLYSVVNTRENVDKWERMNLMSDFGRRMLDVAGSSANIERVLKKKTSGGFAPNTCKAISSLKFNISIMAALGLPKINSQFATLSEQGNVTSISISDPGETLGLEFDDGKVMITDFSNIYDITWNSILSKVKQEKFCELLQSVDCMGFGHWALLLSLDDIWLHLINEIFPSINNLDQKLFFVDLADIKKRTASDVNKMLSNLKKVNDHVPVLLSLNDQESIDIEHIVAKKKVKSSHNLQYFSDLGVKLNDVIKISYLVIHSSHFATITTPDDHSWITEGYTSQPRFTTGAGDHFNAGTVIGLTSSFKPSEAIAIGNALTAVFVRTGESPTLNALSNFIANYLNYIENDIPDFSIN
jgi:hypothetical protein